MAMIKHCRGILLDAEKRIEQIAENEEQEETDEADADSDETEDDVLF
jgi:exonuclease VII small subunit